MSMHRISKAELDRIHQKQFEEERNREVRSTILGPNGKPLNTRKKKGANKTIMMQTIMSKLYQDGFIVKTDFGYEIDASDKIEAAYGGGDVAADVRGVLFQLVMGLRVQGITVKIDDILLDGISEDTNEVHTQIFKKKEEEESDGGSE